MHTIMPITVIPIKVQVGSLKKTNLELSIECLHKIETVEDAKNYIKRVDSKEYHSVVPKVTYEHHFEDSKDGEWYKSIFHYKRVISSSLVDQYRWCRIGDLSAEYGNYPNHKFSTEKYTDRLDFRLDADVQVKEWLEVPNNLKTVQEHARESQYRRIISFIRDQRSLVEDLECRLGSDSLR